MQCQPFFLLVGKDPVAFKDRLVSALLVWLWWAVQDCTVFCRDVPPVHTCAADTTAHSSVHQQAGILGQILPSGRQKDIFVWISVEQEWSFISLTRLESVHSVSFPFTHIFSFLCRASHLSLSHHSPSYLIAVNGIVTFMYSCAISQPVWTLAPKGYHC